MTRTERNVNLLGVVTPFVGMLAAIILLWNRAWTAPIWRSSAVIYLMTAVGITVGFHRLLTHRAFQTHPWLERMFAVLGSLSVQGSVLDWVADHRKHHAHTDREGDPHSPHVGHGSGLRGPLACPHGLAVETQGQADWKRYAAELYEDPKMRADRPALPVAGRALAAGSDRGRLRRCTASRSRARCAATCGADSCGSSSSTT